MALTTEAYFDHLKACIHPEYLLDPDGKGNLELKERGEGGVIVREVSFTFEGEAFCVHLDLPPPQVTKADRKKGEKPAPPRLFRFLDDEAKPWAKKCDFVVFHRLPVGIYAYLIEFKSDGIDAVSIKSQLDSSFNWLKSVQRIVEHYYGHTCKLSVQKFVFSSNTNPSQYLDRSGKYLKADPAIRFYHYDDLKPLSLGDLENKMIDEIQGGRHDQAH
jgi:hypothetical protein